jgi:DNA repair exonuclease SbcCD ATPase subunit
LEVLRSRIGELETVESDLLRSEAQVKELERKLRTFQHNEHFLQSQQQKVLKYDELERQLQHLSEENATLKGQQDNADLLRYKVQTLQDRCARYEGLEAKLAQLELENQHLKEAMKEEGSGEMAMMMVADHREGGDSGRVMSGAKVGGGGGGKSQAALWYRIAELQQKEVLLTAKQGELTSRYIAVCSPYTV